MAFGRSKKTVDFLQKERDELPTHRPVIIYLTCPLSSRDAQQRTQAYSQLKKAEEDGGILTREGNPYNICVVEAERELSRLEEQLGAALERYSEASYKVVVVNGYGTAEGVLLDNEEKVVLTGEALATLAWPHHHDHHFHAVCIAKYGHKFGDSFMKRVSKESGEKKALFAVTYFSSEAVPEAWQRPATVGEAHIELKRDITDFLSKHVKPSSPYKILDPQMSKNATCCLL